ncbi:MAG: four helix bundle protein [Bacteroidales bacterium]
MDTFKTNFRKRLIDLSKLVVEYLKTLDYSDENQIIGKQLIRSVTSVGANYSAACRARSTRDYLHKLYIVQEECDESLYWMQTLITLNTSNLNEASCLIERELNEVLSVIIATIKTLKKRI